MLRKLVGTTRLAKHLFTHDLHTTVTQHARKLPFDPPTHGPGPVTGVDIVDGKVLEKDRKLRFSYKGNEKYEYDKDDAVRPSCGQYFSEGKESPITYSPTSAYRIFLQSPRRVLRRDRHRTRNHLWKFHGKDKSEMATDREYVNDIKGIKHSFSSFLDPLTLELVDQVSWTFKGGVHNGLDIVIDAFEIIKLYQLKKKRESPEVEVELNCNRILSDAITNVRPKVAVEFKQMIPNIKTSFKPCPVPLTDTKATHLAIKKIKKASLKRQVKAPVDPVKLANNILDCYYRRGVLYQEHLDNMVIAYKARQYYGMFGPYRISRKSKKSRPQLMYYDQTVLPLPNDEYAKAPGQPEFNTEQLLDPEDRVKESMEPNNRDVETALTTLHLKLNEVKNSIQSFTSKLEMGKVVWPDVQENYVTLSSQLNMLQKILNKEKTPQLQNLVLLPLVTSQAEDNNLSQMTDGRIPFLTPEAIPNYLRTKMDLAIEQKETDHSAAAHRISENVLQRQILDINNISEALSDMITQNKESWEESVAGQSNNFNSKLPENEQKELNKLISALDTGKGLRVSARRQNSNR